MGQTLTANAGTMMDAEDLPSTTFPTGYTFQWVRADGWTDMDISGATSRTYMPVAADVGKTPKVKVGFTDGAGNSEELTTPATAAVAAAGPCVAGNIWCTTLTVGLGGTRGSGSAKGLRVGRRSEPLHLRYIGRRRFRAGRRDLHRGEPAVGDEG